MEIFVKNMTVLMIIGILTCWVALNAISRGADTARSRNEKLLILTY